MDAEGIFRAPKSQIPGDGAAGYNFETEELIHSAVIGSSFGAQQGVGRAIWVPFIGTRLCVHSRTGGSVRPPAVKWAVDLVVPDPAPTFPELNRELQCSRSA